MLKSTHSVPLYVKTLNKDRKKAFKIAFNSNYAEALETLQACFILFFPHYR